MQSTLVDNLCGPLESYLKQAGIYYRVFARRKSDGSIQKKLNQKRAEYLEKDKKMQDFVGIRIVFYFQDDVEIFHNKLKTMYGYDPANESNTNAELEAITALRTQIEQHAEFKPLVSMFPLHDKVFMPQRLNIVMRIPAHLDNLMRAELPVTLSNDDAALIDSTYEVQLRTVLSEGWHEVEHDLRYKTRNEAWWENCKEESRQLNGIYATLESSESALSKLISGIAYKNYKSNEWDAMIRNHFRLRFNEYVLPQGYIDFLNGHVDVARKCFRLDRSELIQWLWEITTPVPLSTEMALCIINRKKLHVQAINDLERESIKMILDRDFRV